MKAGTKRNKYIPKNERKEKMTDKKVSQLVLKTLCEEHPTEMGTYLGMIDGMNYSRKRR